MAELVPEGPSRHVQTPRDRRGARLGVPAQAHRRVRLGLRRCQQGRVPPLCGAHPRAQASLSQRSYHLRQHSLQRVPLRPQPLRRAAPAPKLWRCHPRVQPVDRRQPSTGAGRASHPRRHLLRQAKCRRRQGNAQACGHPRCRQLFQCRPATLQAIVRPRRVSIHRHGRHARLGPRDCKAAQGLRCQRLGAVEPNEVEGRGRGCRALWCRLRCLFRGGGHVRPSVGGGGLGRGHQSPRRLCRRAGERRRLHGARQLDEHDGRHVQQTVRHQHARSLLVVTSRVQALDRQGLPRRHREHQLDRGERWSSLHLCLLCFQGRLECAYCEQRC
mmetsp:Transcript_105142/g.336451  ORF Transcript_105142/g.336451 Transcript_105142/m.336451 type:complete len:329 (+) Transcript_105142:1558-2544(+)